MTKKRFLKNNLIFMASAVLGGVLGYFFHFVVARRLSVGQYGELLAITSLFAIFGVFSSALSFFIIKYSSVLADHNDRPGQLDFISFVFRKFKIPVAAFLILYLAAMPALKTLLHLADYFGLITIGLSVIFLVFSSFYVNALQGWRNFLWVGLIGAAIPLVKLTAGYLLANFSARASIVSLAFLCSAVAGWLIARFYARRFWREGRSSAGENDWREIYFKGESFRKSFASILLFSLVLAAASNLDILIVKNLASAETAGYYGALSVLGKIILWLNLAVVGVLLPDAFSFGHAGRPAHSRSVLGSYGLIFLVSFPALLFYRLFSGFLVGLLFGGKYVIISQSLWLFGLMALFLSLLTLEANLAMARRDFRSTYLLGVMVLILASGVYLFHADLKQIILSVTFSFSLGWVIILILNLHHRYLQTTK